MDDYEAFEDELSPIDLWRLERIQKAKHHLAAWFGARDIPLEEGEIYPASSIDGELFAGLPVMLDDPCFCGNAMGFGSCGICNAQRRIMSQENIVVLKKSALKEICKRNEIRFSEEAFKSMNAIALEVLVAATEHARQGKRKTIKSQDFKPYHIKD